MEQKNTVKSILELNGCDHDLCDVPVKFDEAPKVLDTNAMASTFQTQKLYDIASQQIEAKNGNDKYWNTRRHFLNQMRASSRNAIIEEENIKIQQILRSGDVEKVKELFRNRHIWRTAIHEFRSDQYPICIQPNCPNVALKGSKYCTSHIMLDENQKLFVKCPICNNPEPINIGQKHLCQCLENKI